jgi:hypothetical protein
MSFLDYRLRLDLFFFKIQIITFTQILPFFSGRAVLGHSIFKINVTMYLQKKTSRYDFSREWNLLKLFKFNAEVAETC